MPGDRTKLTASQLRDKANQHDGVAEGITREQTRLRGEIDSVTGANQGDMIMALDNVHENWQQITGRIVKNLQAMAQQVRQTADQVENKDVELSQAVNRVPAAEMSSPQLSGFLS
ncbi:WXG100 family type VII secretion target [Saccharopolyspora sp. 5N708]|uniref:WXG100 family type VII secretion target n=1 Tax=Saccharopolyspora sp. 5N708 TaxID=3457424 RepID=UPI003FD32737